MDKFELDEYEKDLENSLTKYFEKHNSLPPSVKDSKDLKQKLVSAAKSHNKKSKTISLRVSEFDLDGMKRQASNLGIPYQTYINMVIHKCATGQINPLV